MTLKPIGGLAEGLTGAAGGGGLAESPTADATAQAETFPAPNADTLRGEQNFAGALQARQLQSQLEPQDGQTPPEPVVEFRVNVPRSGDARAMRDAILRGEPFYYTDSDIAAMEASSPGEEFYISANEDGKRDRWATPAEVKKFPVQDEQTTIPVRESLVRDLVAFRANRRIREATAGISDPALRRQVSDQLLAAMTGEGYARVDAALALGTLAKGNDAVARALRTMADDPAGRQNAVLQLAVARTNAADALSRRATFYGPYDDAADFAETRTRVLDAVNLAGGIDPATGRARPDAVIDRDEAALVNKYAAQVFRDISDEANATQREMIGRFYESDAQERSFASLSEWSWVPRWKPSTDGTPSVRAVTDEERRLRQFDEDFRLSQQGPPSRDQALEKAKDIKRMQNARIMNPDTNQRRVEMSEDNGEVYTGRVTTDRKREVNGQIFPLRTYTEQMVNPNGVQRSATRAGAVDLINTGLSYYTLYCKTQELIRYQAARAPLQADVNRVTRFPVPPRPDEVERVAAALEQRLAVATDPQERARLGETLRFVPTMREASRAFWNR